MKIKLTGYVHWLQRSYMLEGEWHIAHGDMSGFPEYTFVKTVEIEVDVADFNPTTARVAKLKAEELELRAQFSARLNEIHRRISELTAIEYSEAT